MRAPANSYAINAKPLANATTSSLPMPVRNLFTTISVAGCLSLREFKSCRQEKRRPNGRHFSWRREQDSNLRYDCSHTRFPSVLLQPLGHLSVYVNYTLADSLSTYTARLVQAWSRSATPRVSRINKFIRDIALRTATGSSHLQPLGHLSVSALSLSSILTDRA